jgi:hypothetical protein
MTNDEILSLLREGNDARATAASAFRRAYDGAETETAKCWAAHMVALECDSPDEKLRWNLESLRAAEAATAEESASSLLPTVLGNVGYSTLLMARPAEARTWYERARDAVATAELDSGRRDAYAVAIDHMIELIDAGIAAETAPFGRE